MITAFLIHNATIHSIGNIGELEDFLRRTKGLGFMEPLVADMGAVPRAPRLMKWSNALRKHAVRSIDSSFSYWLGVLQCCCYRFYTPALRSCPDLLLFSTTLVCSLFLESTVSCVQTVFTLNVLCSPGLGNTMCQQSNNISKSG
ncbi:unnamed protein product [Somion occarium]|uniref:Uncharacterized protein n=1 Tax=Somion occarium TaxID=3059160 RepID=A0ABP1DEM6_9APHY